MVSGMSNIQEKRVEYISNKRQMKLYTEEQVRKAMERIVNIKILRPIILPIIGALLIAYILVSYIFDLENQHKNEHRKTEK